MKLDPDIPVPGGFKWIWVGVTVFFLVLLFFSFIRAGLFGIVFIVIGLTDFFQGDFFGLFFFFSGIFFICVSLYTWTLLLYLYRKLFKYEKRLPSHNAEIDPDIPVEARFKNAWRILTAFYMVFSVFLVVIGGIIEFSGEPLDVLFFVVIFYSLFYVYVFTLYRYLYVKLFKYKKSSRK